MSGYVRLPACVTLKQRAVLHALAEQHHLQHTSVGEGETRQLLLGHSQQPLKVCADTGLLSPEHLLPSLEDNAQGGEFPTQAKVFLYSGCQPYGHCRPADK